MRSQLKIPLKTWRCGTSDVLFYYCIGSEDNIFQSGDMVFAEYKKGTDCDIWENEIVCVSEENVAINVYRFVERFQLLQCSVFIL